MIRSIYIPMRVSVTGSPSSQPVLKLISELARGIRVLEPKSSHADNGMKSLRDGETSCPTKTEIIATPSPHAEVKAARMRISEIGPRREGESRSIKKARLVAYVELNQALRNAGMIELWDNAKVAEEVEFRRGGSIEMH